MDVWSHEERYNQKRTCERISKSSTSDNEDDKEKTKVVQTCYEKKRRAPIKIFFRCAPVPRNRLRGRQIEHGEILVWTICGKCGFKGG